MNKLENIAIKGVLLATSALSATGLTGCGGDVYLFGSKIKGQPEKDRAVYSDNYMRDVFNKKQEKELGKYQIELFSASF